LTSSQGWIHKNSQSHARAMPRFAASICLLAGAAALVADRRRGAAPRIAAWQPSVRAVRETGSPLATLSAAVLSVVLIHGATPLPAAALSAADYEEIYKSSSASYSVPEFKMGTSGLAAPKKVEPEAFAAQKIDDIPKPTPRAAAVKADLPKFEAPKFDIPKFDIPKIDLGLLSIDLPKVEAPKLDLPKIDLPKIELPKPPAPETAKSYRLVEPKVMAPAPVAVAPKAVAPVVVAPTPAPVKKFERKAALDAPLAVSQESRDASARAAAAIYNAADKEASAAEAVAKGLRDEARAKDKTRNEAKDLACETRSGGKLLCFRGLGSGF